MDTQHKPGSPEEAYEEARTKVQQALDNLAAQTRQLKDTHGSWYKAGAAVGVCESTLRHHASAGSKGRRRRYDTKENLKGTPTTQGTDTHDHSVNEPQPAA